MKAVAWCVLVLLILPGCTRLSCHPGVAPVLISAADEARLRLDGLLINFKCGE
jgi:hypothetical protein